MREVARRAGVTHQAPYHHFADRESILAEVIAQGFRDLAAALGRANDQPAASARQVAGESGQAYVGFALRHPGLFRAMFRTDLCDPVRFPAVQQAGALAFAELERMVAIVHGEQADAALAGLYWSVVHGMATLAVDGPLTEQVDDPDQDGLAQAGVLRAVQQRFLDLVCP